MLTVNVASAATITFLTPGQFTKAGGIKITLPGIYVFTDDVIFNTVSAAAITIASNDVTIDMNGKTLISNMPGQIGINIVTLIPAVNNNNNFYNIVIKNGTFDSFDRFGIMVNGGERNITLENLTIICGVPISSGPQIPTGIFFNGNSSAPISEIAIKNCRIVEGRYGILASTVSNVELLDTVLSENFSSGALLIQSNLWDIRNCTFSHQLAFDAAGSAGLTAKGCTLFNIKNCHFSYNVSTIPAVPVAGVNFVGMPNAMSGSHILENCTFSSNAATTGSVAGVQLVNTQSCVFRNCIANGNASLGSSAAGFSVITSSSGNAFENCVADGNYTNGPVVGAGFNIASGDNFVFNCIANGNQSLGGGAGNGIFVTSFAPGCLVQNCLAIDNSTNGFINDSTSAFIGNFATQNGVANFAGAGIIGSIPIPNGTQPPGGSFDERQIDNIQIT